MSVDKSSGVFKIDGFCLFNFCLNDEHSGQTHLVKDILVIGKCRPLEERLDHIDVQNLVSNGNTNAASGL